MFTNLQQLAESRYVSHVALILHGPWQPAREQLLSLPVYGYRAMATVFHVVLQRLA